MSPREAGLMKLQWVVRTLGRVAAMALAAAPALAASPPPLGPPAASARNLAVIRSMVSYDLMPVIAAGAASKSPDETGRAEPRHSQWSPQIVNWSSYDLKFIDSDRYRFRLSQGGLETVVDGRLVRSRVDLSRRRVQLVLSTDF